MSLEKRARDYSASHAAGERAAAGASARGAGSRTPHAEAVDTPRQARVPVELAGLRLDQALARLFPEYSRSRLQSWVRSAQVTVDGAPAQPRDKVWGGERIVLDAQVHTEASERAQAIPLAIVYEDATLLVIDKPAGLVVHPGSGNRDGTMMNALLHHAPSLAALPRAGIVHRLDKDTSGLLVVAKTLPAQADLVRQLQARSVKREYLAIAAGAVPPQRTIEAPIGRHPVQRTRMAVVERGKPALTRVRSLRRGRGWSLIECTLETGRTHQIRVHLANIGHPLIGDPVYLGRAAGRALPAAARAFPRQALHAARLALVHPVSGELVRWESPLPGDMRALLADLERDAAAG
jgi:23S rRNA pseudouridine1911/1915/1917 synthase